MTDKWAAVICEIVRKLGLCLCSKKSDKMRHIKQKILKLPRAIWDDNETHERTSPPPQSTKFPQIMSRCRLRNIYFPVLCFFAFFLLLRLFKWILSSSQTWAVVYMCGRNICEEPMYSSSRDGDARWARAPHSTRYLCTIVIRVDRAKATTTKQNEKAETQ